MIASVVTAWLHYVAVILLAGGLFTQLYLLKLTPGLESLRLLARVDRLYGIAALLVLLTGLARMPIAHGGKGVAYYLHTGAFHGALTLFVLTALISLVPTLRYRSWMRAANSGTLPTETQWRSLRKFTHIQLTGVVLIASMMALMARAG